ncbi:MAG TPA: hypothetical protein VFP56_00285 [Candidatus Limnocylindrales bacterium]|nr:hypothetical protein [Candidatus Limnocylindrales bacterium]
MPRLEIDLDDDDARVLRGALLAARATELASIRRRDTRLFAGYGTETSRDDMTAEMDRHRRRIELLDRVIEALRAPDS